MNGMELARAYYEEYGRPVLEKDFSQLLPYLAVGLAGSGSECFGFDDEVSRDHDFGPGFCIWLPEEETVSRRDAFLLERAYAKLPGEFMGYKRPKVEPAGGPRKGVMRCSDFFVAKTGSPDGMLTTEQWLTVPYASLAEAVNGSVFFDGYGVVTEIRKRLSLMPEDVMKKRLSGHLLLMAQSGQYNYRRCLDHGETEAAQLACTEFVKNASSAVFLMNGSYPPYYKWTFRSMRNLGQLSEIAEKLSAILTLGNDPEPSFKKDDLIEETATLVIGGLIEKGLTRATCGDLEKHAYSVNDAIADSAIRNLHILATV